MKPNSKPQEPLGQTGGTVIRKVIAGFKAFDDPLLTAPISSHILCAVSSGPDSTALAHLLAVHGRKIAPKNLKRTSKVLGPYDI